MKAQQLLVRGLAGTSFMTLFSYLVSAYKKENFKEPQLLGAFIEPAFPQENSEELAVPAGWCFHYSMGLAWTAMHRFLINKTNIPANIKSAIVIGAMSGAFGALIWKLLFKYHPAPPHTNTKKFYRHLVLAHIIFSSITIPEHTPVRLRRRGQRAALH